MLGHLHGECGGLCRVSQSRAPDAGQPIGGVGYEGLHAQENDTGPDDCNHAQFGAFILAAPGLPLQGELQGVHLLNVAPTLLELGGYDVPESMQGTSLLGSAAARPSPPPASGEDVVRERLKGLGYLG